MSCVISHTSPVHLPRISHLTSHRLSLQLGNIEAADDAFNRLECLVRDADTDGQVRLHRGWWRPAPQLTLA